MERVGMVEVVLSPHSTLAGWTFAPASLPREVWVERTGHLA
jgi:hypothetical protein